MLSGSQLWTWNRLQETIQLNHMFQGYHAASNNYRLLAEQYDLRPAFVNTIVSMVALSYPPLSISNCYMIWNDLEQFFGKVALITANFLQTHFSHWVDSITCCATRINANHLRTRRLYRWTPSNIGLNGHIWGLYFLLSCLTTGNQVRCCAVFQEAKGKASWKSPLWRGPTVERTIKQDESIDFYWAACWGKDV